jgi:hypothetical protein
MGIENSDAASFWKKFIKARSLMSGATKDAKGAFKNSYATLQSVYDEVIPPCLGVGLAVIQSATIAGKLMTVATVIADSDTGFTHESQMQLILDDKALTPQGCMGARTYGCRGGMLHAFCLPTEDDDGASASPSNAPPRPSIPSRPQTGPPGPPRKP